jgi:lipoprotein-anchoring transpeptidase ErfK/SrfK
MYRVLTLTLVALAAAIPANAQQAQKVKEVMEGGPKPTITPKAPPVISFRSQYKAGTILIDTKRRRLVYTLPGGRAYLYPITVGKLGFQWSGTHRISAKRDWPDWRPPADMRERKPDLPRLMTGGLYNPLGAKALYIGSTLYRIHGTNNAKSIGLAASSGCIRMHNAHVTHLAQIAKIGTKVVVKPQLPSRLARTFVPTEVPGVSRSAPQRRISQPRRTEPPRRDMAWRRAILGLN